MSKRNTQKISWVLSVLFLAMMLLWIDWNINALKATVAGAYGVVLLLQAIEYRRADDDGE